jgi:hypothetical protein
MSLKPEHGAILRIGQALLATILCASGGAWAQLVELADKDNFSQDAIALTFQELGSTSPASDVYTSYGVRFVSESGGPMWLASVPLQAGFLPNIARVLRNEPPPNVAADDSLIVKFEDALHRLGLQLDSIAGEPGTTATVQAFNVKGELLGMIEHPVPARPELIDQSFSGTFLGLETSDPLGISTVVIDYGPEQPIEQVNEILIDYITPRVFRTYVPHIVQAAVGDLLFQTSIEVVGFRTVQEATVRFFDPLGEPLSLDFNGEEASELHFVFPIGNVFDVKPGPPTEGLKVGYAVVESAHPFVAQASYRASTADGLLAQVTSPAIDGQLLHRFSVRREVDQRVDTAIAVINAGSRDATPSFRLLSADGTVPDAVRTQPYMRVPPGELRTFYFSELCDQTPPEDTRTFCSPIDFLKTGDFNGSLRILSTEPTVVLVLRTVDGLPVSLVPVGGSAQR